MKALRVFLQPLLEGKPLEQGPATALSTAIWLLRLRLDDMNAEVWRKPDERVFKKLFERRLQLLEDIAALEILLARAEGRRLFDSPEPTQQPAGPGYGET